MLLQFVFTFVYRRNPFDHICSHRTPCQYICPYRLPILRRYSAAIRPFAVIVVIIFAFGWLAHACLMRNPRHRHRCIPAHIRKSATNWFWCLGPPSERARTPARIGCDRLRHAKPIKTHTYMCNRRVTHVSAPGPCRKPQCDACTDYCLFAYEHF